jgi:hypothetical protein
MFIVYVYHMVFSYYHLMSTMNSAADSTAWILWIGFQWTQVCRYLSRMLIYRLWICTQE